MRWPANSFHGAERPTAADTRTLLALLRPSVEPSAITESINLPASRWNNLTDQATRHGVAPLLHRALLLGGRLPQIPSAAVTKLAAERQITALDNLRNFSEFGRVARALQAHSIPMIALKGMHLADLVYRDISLRPMSDIDILVPFVQVDAAVEVLVSLGYLQNSKLASGYDIGLTAPRLEILLELHWNLAAPSEPCTPPIDEIWRTAVQARIADADVLVMTPEFLLLHVCAHLAYHHLFALDFRALCDIDEIVHSTPQFDWEFLIDRAQHGNMARGVAAALRMAREQLGTAVPEDVLSRLGGNALDQRFLEDALEQMSAHPDLPQALQFAPNLLRLAAAASPLSRLAMLLRRIFIPRTELAALYGIPDQRARILPFYAIRLLDLLRNYGGSAWALVTDRSRLAGTSARNERLAIWLSNS